MSGSIESLKLSSIAFARRAADHAKVCTMNSVIIWDLETVPDLRGPAAANDLGDKSDDEIREAMGDKFPKHVYHSIACISALIAYRSNRRLIGQLWAIPP